MNLESFSTLCRRLGKVVPWWVQGPGGNVSFKTKKKMIIKASGLRLDQIRPHKGLVEMSIPALRRDLNSIQREDASGEKKYAAALKNRAKPLDGTSRPSMEAGMHVFFPRKIVIHIHSLVALLMAHKNKTAPHILHIWLRKNWKDSFRVLPPIRPGLVLTNRLKTMRGSSLYILENHGVILHSETKSIVDKWKKLEKKFCKDFSFGDIRSLRSKAVPLRLYFPDSVVFERRMRKVLLKKGRMNKESVYGLSKRGWTQDRDACELWEASQALYQACPELSELPDGIKRKVGGLPTELYRKKISSRTKK